MKKRYVFCLVLSILILFTGLKETTAEEKITFNLERYIPNSQYSEYYLNYSTMFTTSLLILLSISPTTPENSLLKNYDVSLKFFIIAPQEKPVIAIMLDKIKFPIWMTIINNEDTEEEIRKKATMAAGVSFLRIKNLEDLLK